jgi:hypothetical protein
MVTAPAQVELETSSSRDASLPSMRKTGGRRGVLERKARLRLITCLCLPFQLSTCSTWSHSLPYRLTILGNSLFGLSRTVAPTFDVQDSPKSRRTWLQSEEKEQENVQTIYRRASSFFFGLSPPITLSSLRQLGWTNTQSFESFF